MLAKVRMPIGRIGIFNFKYHNALLEDISFYLVQQLYMKMRVLLVVSRRESGTGFT